MSNIEIKHLLQKNRLPENDTSLFIFILYLPLGLVLFVSRTILLLGLFILGQLLPDTPISQKLTNRVACLVLGISVNVENPKAKENVGVYVSNSMSIFDQLAVSSATGSVSPRSSTFLEKLLGLSTYSFGSMANFDNFKNNISQFMAEKKTPLYFSPEGKLTNGKALLKFKTYPFQFAPKVQPICITIDRPFLNITVTTLGSSYFNDVFFFMFCPMTNYKLKFLASLDKKCLTDSAFADIVRQNMATSLKIVMTDFTASDLAEFEKRALVQAEHRQAGNYARAINPELQRMSSQVREVLPHVPFNAIYNDLCITRSVDATITNILEGHIHFVPEQTSPSSSRDQPSTSPSSDPIKAASSSSGSKFDFKTAASSFPKSASERNKSFQERKEQLIATARKRYMEKNNMDIPL